MKVTALTWSLSGEIGKRDSTAESDRKYFCKRSRREERESEAAAAAGERSRSERICFRVWRSSSRAWASRSE